MQLSGQTQSNHQPEVVRMIYCWCCVVKNAFMAAAAAGLRHTPTQERTDSGLHLPLPFLACSCQRLQRDVALRVNGRICQLWFSVSTRVFTISDCGVQPSSEWTVAAPSDLQKVNAGEYDVWSTRHSAAWLNGPGFSSGRCRLKSKSSQLCRSS